VTGVQQLILGLVLGPLSLGQLNRWLTQRHEYRMARLAADRDKIGKS
jgi:hypothetical protein